MYMYIYIYIGAQALLSAAEEGSHDSDYTRTVRMENCSVGILEMSMFDPNQPADRYMLDMQNKSACQVLREIYTRMHCNTLQHTATRCNTLQHTATTTNVLDMPNKCAQGSMRHTLQRAATRCNTLQHAATRCNTLKNTITTTHVLDLHNLSARHAKLKHSATHTSTHCNTLQHTTITTHVLDTTHLHARCSYGERPMNKSYRFEH